MHAKDNWIWFVYFMLGMIFLHRAFTELLDESDRAFDSGLEEGRWEHIRLTSKDSTSTSSDKQSTDHKPISSQTPTTTLSHSTTNNDETTSE